MVGKPLQAFTVKDHRSGETISPQTLAGKVVVVTLAASPWVHTSVKNFFPWIQKAIDELEIPIIYARDLIKDDKAGHYDKNKFNDLCFSVF